MKRIYTSIDIGSDSIKVVVCELFNNRLNLLAASSIKSKGIKRGLITDVDEATLCIKQAFEEVESMLGITIKKVIASVPAYFVEYSLVKSEIDITNEDSVVTGKDVSKVFLQAIQNNIAVNREMVTILPVDFKLDDKSGISIPNGLVGKKLSTRAIMVTTPKKNIYSVLSLLESIGIEVIDISLSSIGDVCAFRNDDIENKLGAIVNIGSETTTVSIFNKGVIVKSSIIGMGGKNIDNDLAYIYKTNLITACRLKEKFALAHKRHASVSDIYELENIYGEKIKVNRFEVSEIVMARIEEILNLARKEINILTNKEIEYIIVTGGTSNISQFENIVDEVFNHKATVGNLKLLGVRNNKYTSAVGNVIYFINILKLKGLNYSMVSNEDMENLSTVKKNIINISNESMLGKVFGYFFGE
ncbi:MAG: cell division protein FtsA [Bacilli bacterium]|nr:cell division protein FtsA [Bacilli bacterium]MDD4809146.1 cell division protein FtsA [Bacilli bacterium]